MNSDKLNQKVLCIKSDILFENGKWNGLNNSDLDVLLNTIKTQSKFIIRRELETNPDYKQIIPQVAFRYDGKFFLHKQLDTNEKRLNNLCPLLVGGHVEEFDIEDEKDLIETALDREVDEETSIDAKIIQKKLYGLVYVEDENPVNHVHVGIIYIVDLDSDQIVMKEEGLQTVGFVDEKYLVENLDRLTYWSRIFVNNYFNIK